MNQFKYHGYIYITINQQENKCYVGQKAFPPNKTKNYLGSGSYFKNAIKKYGKQFFKKIILGEIFSNDLEDFKKQLDECETECIYFFRAYGSDGKNYDSIYGYNLVRESKTTLGLPSEIRKEAGRKLSIKLKENPEIKIQAVEKWKIDYKNKTQEKIKEQVDKRKQTIEENPKIEINRILKLKETLKDNPEIEVSRQEKRRRTIVNNPEIEIKRKYNFLKKLEENPEIQKNITKNRLKTEKDNPEIRINAAKKYKKTYENKSEKEKQIRGNNISIGKSNMSQDKKDRVNKDISNTLKNKSKEERDIINKKTRQKYIDDPSKKERESIKSKKTKRAKKENVGKAHPLYIALDYSLLIDLFFSGMANSKILATYSTSVFPSITNVLLKRFLATLNFPIPMNSSINKEIRLKFIEENKHKIQWYKDNYERLEEEYFLKLFNSK